MSAHTEPEDQYGAEMHCPHCGEITADWLPLCQSCKQSYQTQERAITTEIRHILYLLRQVRLLQGNTILPFNIAEAVYQQYHNRLNMLTNFGDVVQPTPAPQPAGAGSATPPPLPPNYQPQTVPTRSFFEAHGFKALFVFAALLVILALRALLNDEALNFLVSRLLPAILGGLALMFWVFGGKTENTDAWAGFVYRAMSVVTLGFTTASVMVYWLPFMGQTVTFPPTVFASCLAALIPASLLLASKRSFHYLHLFETTVLATLFGLVYWIQAVFVKTGTGVPIWLCGLPAVVWAAVNMSLAVYHARKNKAQNTDANGKWSDAFALWGNLSAAVGVIFALWFGVLQKNADLYELAPLLCIAGVMFIASAQLLGSKAMGYVSGVLLMLGATLWYIDAKEEVLHRYILIPMTFSVVYAALSGFQKQSNPMTDVWKTLALLLAGFAGTVMCVHFYVLGMRLSAPGTLQTLTETIGITILLSLLYTGISLWQKQASYLYGVLLLPAVALVVPQFKAHSQHLIWFWSLIGSTWLFVLVGGSLLYRNLKKQATENATPADLAEHRHLASVFALLIAATWFVVPYQYKNPHSVWYPLLMLPCLMGLYGWAFWSRRNTEDKWGESVRNIAFVLSGVVLVYSCVVNNLFNRSTPISDQKWLTMGIAAYGICYLARTVVISRASVATGAWLLSLAYFHYLWWYVGEPLKLDLLGEYFRIGGKWFLLLTTLPSVVWLCIAALLQKRQYTSADLFTTSGILTLVTPLCVIFSPLSNKEQALLASIAMAIVGVVWLGHWALKHGEICWHFAAWGLLLGWFVFAYGYINMHWRHFDLTVLPLCGYLLLAGHRSSHRKQHLENLFWILGLILMMLPAWVLYWGDQKTWWHVWLLIGECLVAVLWGVARQIRAYVVAGIGFVTLLVASVLIGRYIGYVLTLGVLFSGVLLFVVGFIALTHREQAQRFLRRIQEQWKLWQQWR